VTDATPIRLASADEFATDGLARLDLGDWRRRVSELYARIRETARTDPQAAWRDWAETRQRLYRDHPQSPVPVRDRAAFRARHFDYDPDFRFEVEVEVVPDVPTAPAPDVPLALELPVSAGGTMSFTRIGWLTVPFGEGTRRLALYWMSGYAGGLFLPFRDATNGAETYGAGRYLLDAAKSADLGGDTAHRTLTLDFNFAYQPSCAFDPKWACPLAPPENRLDIAIRAGERIA
jgi:uncharacterized protein (DUF1684 family)